MTDFSLYLDDSGHPKDQPFLVVAGYVSNDTKWLSFEAPWAEALDKLNLPNPFHMTDFMVEKKYSDIKRDHILAKLCAITRKHTDHMFVCGLDLRAWKKVNNEFALEECHGAPYALAARSLAKDLHLWKQSVMKNEDHLLTFVEEGTLHYGDLQQVFKRDGLPIPNTVPKSCPQMQPSDIFAWETFNYLRSGSPSNPSQNLHRLTKHLRLKKKFGGIIRDGELLSLCKETGVMRRDSMRSGETIRFHSERKRVRKRTVQ